MGLVRWSWPGGSDIGLPVTAGSGRSWSRGLGTSESGSSGSSQLILADVDLGQMGLVRRNWPGGSDIGLLVTGGSGGPGQVGLGKVVWGQVSLSQVVLIN